MVDPHFAVLSACEEWKANNLNELADTGNYKKKQNNKWGLYRIRFEAGLLCQGKKSFRNSLIEGLSTNLKNGFLY